MEDTVIRLLKVRWHDGYYEEFRAVEYRHSKALLWLVLESGENRHIPLCGVRWFEVVKACAIRD